MKYLLIISILFLFSCGNKTNEQSLSENRKKITEPIIMKIDNYLTSTDLQRHAIFPFDTSRDSALFDGPVTPTDLSKNEIAAIEKFIAGEIVEYNKKGYREVKQPEKYFKQLIPVINSKGEKEVWVDCFCGVTPDWKKYREHVNDGGSCFLHFKINLTKGKILKFFTNGLA